MAYHDHKKIWGPHYWFVLHSAAAAYDPSKSGSKDGFKTLVDSYKYILPCEVCKQHLRSNLRKLKLDLYFGSADQLFLWTYYLHDMVNRQLGKKSISFPRAKAFYFRSIGLDCKGCQI